MNAPVFDPRPALRDDIAEHLAQVRLHAEIAQMWLDSPGPDDAGAEYAFRRLMIYVRFAATSLIELKEINGTKRKAGAPEGNRNAAQSLDETTLYNVQDCISAPSGNSAEAGLRRIDATAKAVQS